MAAGPAGPQRTAQRRAGVSGAARTRDERVTQLTLEALPIGTDRPPVPARFARSVGPEDALASPDELSRRAKDG
ncbi:hypothetical protein [Nonomuraea dietziae]|uniref:hypothetical protein n=1 Tax=Nonomuraea dietziae TaxID=65515 RepID=UPI0033EA58B0